MNPVTKISYSKYALWQQCPRKFKYVYVDGLKEPSSEVLERGTQMHKEVEEYIKLPSMPLPACAIGLADYFIPLQGKAIAEEFWSADEDFEPTYGYDPATCYVGKLDLHLDLDTELLICDVKTGKVRPKQVDQLEFYAIMGFKRYPNAEKIVVDLAYLDHNQVVSHTFLRTQLDTLIQSWRARLEPFRNELVFKPNPTALCGWCHFSSTKGGVCEAG